MHMEMRFLYIISKVNQEKFLMLRLNQVGATRRLGMSIRFFDNPLTENEEKMLLISIIGTLETLKRKSIAINEAEKYLFSPHMINKLRDNGCSSKIIDILERGCELEDIASLLPQSLTKNINELQEQALKIVSEYQIYDKKFWI